MLDHALQIGYRRNGCVELRPSPRWLPGALSFWADFQALTRAWLLQQEARVAFAGVSAEQTQIFCQNEARLDSDSRKFQLGRNLPQYRTSPVVMDGVMGF